MGTLAYFDKPGLSPLVSVKDFGAVGNGATNDTSAFQAAIDYAFNRGGGVVKVPDGQYLISGNLTLKSNVTLLGKEVGTPEYLNVSGVSGISLASAKGPVLRFTNTSNPAITLSGSSPTLAGLVFYYPNQVAPTSAGPPTVYPATVVTPSTSVLVNPVIRDCFWVNAYTAIDFSPGVGNNRAQLYNLWIGALYRAIIIDGAVDIVRMVNVHMMPFWDLALDLSYPQNIDTWVKANAYAVTFMKADWPQLTNVFSYGYFCGLYLKDSPNTTGPWAAGRNSYGIASNFQVDNCAYGILAQSTGANGWELQGVQIYVAHNDKIGICTQLGGTVAPHLRIKGGMMAGSTTYGVYHESGKLHIDGLHFNDVPTTASVSYRSTPSYMRLGGCQWSNGSGVAVDIQNAASGKVSLHDNDFGAMSVTVPATLPSGGRRFRGNFGLTDAG